MKIKDLVLCIVFGFFGLIGLFGAGMITGVVIEGTATWELWAGIVLGLLDCGVGIYTAIAHFIASATDHE